MSIKFFGDVDKNQKGDVGSFMPAWYSANHLDTMKETFERKERSIKRGEVPMDAIPEAKAEIVRDKEKYEAILKSKPTVDDTERNLLWKHYKALSKKIQASMFTRSEMMLGTASAHEEADRMSLPVIELGKEELALAKSANIKITDEKVTRNGASKIFKLIGKLLGEPTNIETLRKDRVTTAGKARQTVA